MNAQWIAAGISFAGLALTIALIIFHAGRHREALNGAAHQIRTDLNGLGGKLNRLAEREDQRHKLLVRALIHLAPDKADEIAELLLQ